MTELRGHLQDFGLAAVVQLVAELGRSGCLRISQAGWVGELHFAHGHVVAADVGEHDGQTAIELIALALADGDFVYSDCSPPAIDPHRESCATDLQRELQDLLARPKCRGRPLLHSVPRVSLLEDATANGEIALSRTELAMLLDVNGRRTTEEIMRGRNSLLTLRTLMRMSEAGVIALEPPAVPIPAPPPAVAIPAPPPATALPPAATVPDLPLVAVPGSVERPRRGVRRDLVTVAVLTVLFVIALRTGVQSVHVEGQSMLPGLQDGQLLIVNRLAYLFGPPQRGDVVVFQMPNTSDTELVKRITGLPGEKVRIAGANVFVDDRLLDEPYAMPDVGGSSPSPEDGDAVSVPEDSYFVLGDNRRVSLDSRLGWFVRADQLVGRAWLSYWPPDAWGLVAQPTVRELLQPPAADVAPVEVATVPTAVSPDPTSAPVVSQLVVALPVPSPTPTVRTLLTGAVGQAGWPSDPNGPARFDGNSYRLAARQPAHFVAVTAPVEGMHADVMVSAAFHKTGGPPGGGYGVIVRDNALVPRDGVDQSGEFYVAEANDRGEIGMWRREDDHWVDMLPWTQSEAVDKDGGTNELTLRAVGQRLTFMVNGVEATTLVDKVLSAGRVGVFVGGDNNEVVLDRLTVQVPPPTMGP
jgi:signal peptidase I